MSEHETLEAFLMRFRTVIGQGESTNDATKNAIQPGLLREGVERMNSQMAIEPQPPRTLMTLVRRETTDNE